ncbi:MAG: hypothetical protein EPN74_01960 [Rhodanobacter sp.]|nr:MAG: hypothetical protein EPN74_01960 [Rhodanobacter sp.]
MSEVGLKNPWVILEWAGDVPKEVGRVATWIVASEDAKAKKLATGHRCSVDDAEAWDRQHKVLLQNLAVRNECLEVSKITTI